MAGSNINAQTEDLMKLARELLQSRFGHADLRPGQAEAIQSILSGRSLLAVMPTGSGKSLLYQLPALVQDGLTLVVSPLIALMKDQVDELARKRIPATFINSSLGMDEQQRRLEACIEGAVHLLYVAPERFAAASFVAAVRQLNVKRMAIDEAHCISQWGHDFRPDYRRLKEYRKLLGNPPVTALTATATPRVQQDIIDCLGLSAGEVDVHVHGFDRPNLALSVVQAGDEERKDAALASLVANETGCGIVYVGTRKAAEQVTKNLKRVEPSTIVYHAGLDAEARSAAQEAFLKGKARVVVATLAFGMGIDKSDVRFVVHYHYPASLEQYYQEIGRAGRDGNPSKCVLLYSPGDRYLREFFIDMSNPTAEQVRSVYEAIWSIPGSTIQMTYKQLAEMCPRDVKEGHAGSAVRLLDHAGLTRSLGAEPTATVEFLASASALLTRLKGAGAKVLAAISEEMDLEAKGPCPINLARVCRNADMTESQVRRVLTSLEAEGQIIYQPPFRGRGIEKLVDPPPAFEDVPIDWPRQEMLRSLEYEKLAAIEQYVRGSRCRRWSIVSYFGQKDVFKCGVCDCCTSPGGSGSILEDAPQLTTTILDCVKALPFPLGAGMLTKLLTGSRDKKLKEWRLDRLRHYGAIEATPATVRRAIEGLIEARCLQIGGQEGRPTLSVTKTGEIARSSSPPAPAATSQATKKVKIETARPAMDTQMIANAVLKCVASLDRPVGLGKVAEILCGSKSKWINQCGASSMDVYGAVDMPQQKMRKIIAGMISGGLLCTEGDEYPVLQLTAQGREELRDGAARVELAAPPPQSKTKEQPCGDPPAASAAQTPQPGQACRMLDSLLESFFLLEADGARELLDDLRVFHPKAIMERVRRHHEGSTSQRAAARAIWLAGELGGKWGLDFLAARGDHGDERLRALQRTAAAKAAAIAARDAASPTSASAMPGDEANHLPLA